jgi:hypothetical protein
MPTSKKPFAKWKEMAVHHLRVMKPLRGGHTKTIPEYVSRIQNAEEAGWTKQLFLDYMKRYLERKLPD